MRASRVAVAALAIVAVAGLANASDFCAGEHYPEILPGVYLAWNGYFCHSDYCGLWFTYVYVESNGVPGLQRGNGSVLGVHQDWYCLEASPVADTLVG